MNLNTLDWIVICAYLAALIGLSVALAGGQKTSRDYYLAGNKTAPLPIALSTMATQCSTNSLLGAPAFVAFATGGGILWLTVSDIPATQFDLAVFFSGKTIWSGHPRDPEYPLSDSPGLFNRSHCLWHFSGSKGLSGDPLLGGCGSAGRHHGCL
jgi:uncharacterized sodium:solute symporter family permease YidK